MLEETAYMPSGNAHGKEKNLQLSLICIPIESQSH